MKYNQWPAFFNHIHEASSKGHLSHAMALIGGSEGDRRFCFEKLIKAYGKSEVRRFKASAHNLSEVMDSLNSLSLFGDLQVICFEGFDKLKKEEQAVLGEYIVNPNPHARLILGASGVKGIADLYQKGKKELVLLDISGEKPWDKPTRLKLFVNEFLKEQSKKIAPDALNYLFDHLEPEIDVLLNALEKILCFTAGETLIDKTALQKLISEKPQALTWQMAENIIFGPLTGSLDLPKDVGVLIQTLGALRMQIVNALKVCALLAKDSPPDAFIAQFPQMRSASLEKYIQKARSLKTAYFFKAQRYLYEMECQLKSSQEDPDKLLLNFILKLETLKKS